MAAAIRPVALITGAGSGIGRASAIALARAGLDIALVGRHDKALRETASLLPPESQSLIAPADISDPTSGESIIAATLARFHRLDVLVNNAGLAPLLPIDQTDPDTVERVYRTNAIGPACTIAAAWRIFKQQHAAHNTTRFGHVVINISTLGTADPFPGFFAYAASKAALNVMAMSCASEGRDIGVRAFSIAPGAVETPMLRALFSKQTLPPERCLTPERVADEVLACITGERDALNGKTIFLPGN